MPVADLAGAALWTCLLLALAVSVDAVLPLVPSEVALVGRGAAEQPCAGALAGLLLATAAGLTVEGVRRLRSRAEPAQPREPVPVRETSRATCSW